MVKGADVDNVDFTRTPSLRSTRFTEYLIRKNALDEGGFKGWAFCPGMLFNSTDKWWGDRGKRGKPHEGLDLCFYKDREDTILRLGEEAKVPVIYNGRVVRIADDFLGKSVVIEHLLSDFDNNRFCTIYGHTIPEDNLHVGKIVKEGDVIATLADSSRSKTNILPHLHISLGWTSKVISYDRLDWENISAPNMLTLLDPLQVLIGKRV
ncbi:MAG: M23 family metallopeptidase [Deltaproteobacteria bacterium]|nr:M23 family metallopeptidase [Deltaproteobacteria bacterium]